MAVVHSYPASHPVLPDAWFAGQCKWIWSTEYHRGNHMIGITKSTILLCTNCRCLWRNHNVGPKVRQVAIIAKTYSLHSKQSSGYLSVNKSPWLVALKFLFATDLAIPLSTETQQGITLPLVNEKLAFHYAYNRQSPSFSKQSQTYSALTASMMWYSQKVPS